MILSLYGETERGQVLFKMPNIVLDPRLHYVVGVYRVYFILDSQHSIFENLGNHDGLMISSNLVDRSATNPHQSIVYFDYTRRDKMIQSFEAASIIYQPLQLRELSSASFAICRVNGEVLTANFKTIFLQLEIKRKDNYGWF